MSFGTTWSEELVVEWLVLKGYFILTNVPYAARKRGGAVVEADAVGFKIFDDGSAEVLHVEVGSYYESAEKLVEMVNEKFYKYEAELKNYLKYYLGSVAEKARYRRIFVSVAPISDEVKNKLQELSIEVLTLDEAVNEVFKAFNNWVNHLKTMKLRKPGTQVTPPQHFRAVPMLFYLHKLRKLNTQ
jgi:hypothetical protein